MGLNMSRNQRASTKKPSNEGLVLQSAHQISKAKPISESFL
jgi:hypothetical protein